MQKIHVEIFITFSFFLLISRQILRPCARESNNLQLREITFTFIDLWMNHSNDMITYNFALLNVVYQQRSNRFFPFTVTRKSCFYFWQQVWHHCATFTMCRFHASDKFSTHTCIMAQYRSAQPCFTLITIILDWRACFMGRKKYVNGISHHLQIHSAFCKNTHKSWAKPSVVTFYLLFFK